MQVVVRALDILKSVASSSSPLSLADISAQLDLPAPTVHRFLSVLTDQGYVSKDSLSRRYVAGPEVLTLMASQHLARLADVSIPVLERLSERFDETVFVNRLAGEQAVCVAVIESSRPLRLNLHTGDVLAWHAAASARSILAYLPAGSAERLLGEQGMKSFTANTPRSLTEVDQHLEHVRSRGYDVCDDELDDGVWAAAAPIIGPTGAILGSVTLGAPAERLHDEALRDQVIDAVVEAAGDIAGALAA